MRKLLWLILALVVLIGFLHYLGSIFYFYWNSFWFDAFMHILGGLAIGLLGLWLWFSSGIFERSVPSRREAFLAALVTAVLVGLGWEYFEFVYGIAVPAGVNYGIDTFHDLVADFLGGVAAGLLGRFKDFYV